DSCSGGAGARGTRCRDFGGDSNERAGSSKSSDVVVPAPFMRPQQVDQCRWERRTVRVGEVLSQSSRSAHPDDRGRYGGRVQRESDGGFGEGAVEGPYDRLESCHALERLGEALAAKHGRQYGIALPSCGDLRRPCAAERTRVEGDTGDDSGSRRRCRRKEGAFWLLFEDVVDDLDGVHHAESREFDAVLRAIVTERDADPVDLALPSQHVQRIQPIAVAHPVRAPAVQLEQIDTVAAETLE